MVFKDVLRQRAKKSSSVSLLRDLAPEQIISAPLLTEKTYAKMESDVKVYYFKVHTKSTKNDVKQAIKAIYNVEPKTIRTTNVSEKGRANRKLVRRAYKKAIITLKKWDTIELVS